MLRICIIATLLFASATSFAAKKVAPRASASLHEVDFPVACLSRKYAQRFNSLYREKVISEVNMPQQFSNLLLMSLVPLLNAEAKHVVCGPLRAKIQNPTMLNRRIDQAGIRIFEIFKIRTVFTFNELQKKWEPSVRDLYIPVQWAGRVM